MKILLFEGKYGIQWKVLDQLEDLNLGDDLVLLSYTHEQMKMKTTNVTVVNESVGHNIHKEKKQNLQI